MNKIERYLIEKKISPACKGFRCLAIGISLVRKDEKYLYAVTTRLYPQIAQTMGDTVSCVERAIRHAIGTTGKSYTNGEFIGIAALELK